MLFYIINFEIFIYIVVKSKKELNKKVAKRIKQTEEFNLKETRRYPVSIFLFVGWGFFFFNPNLEGK